MSVTDFSRSRRRTFTWSRCRKFPPKSLKPANSSGRRASAAGPHTSSSLSPYIITVNSSSVGASPTSCTGAPPSSQFMRVDLPEEWLPRNIMHGTPPLVTDGRLNL